MEKVKTATGRFQFGDEEIRYVLHDSFMDRKLRKAWEDGWVDQLDESEFAGAYMPDEVTRESVRHMHYAAFRADTARRLDDRKYWVRRYYTMRDRVVLGNRKLIFGAVRKKVLQNQSSDDLIGECYIVMIRAVAAYNPWMGIRFSTYAYTCLMRALSRMNQRSISDRFSRHLSLDHVVGNEPVSFDEPGLGSGNPPIESYLREEHPLLTSREKTVLRRRFHIGNARENATLEKVGQDLGISKERVRQVQASALEKLRIELVGTANVAY